MANSRHTHIYTYIRDDKHINEGSKHTRQLFWFPQWYKFCSYCQCNGRTKYKTPSFNSYKLEKELILQKRKLWANNTCVVAGDSSSTPSTPSLIYSNHRKFLYHWPHFIVEWHNNKHQSNKREF